MTRSHQQRYHFDRTALDGEGFTCVGCGAYVSRSPQLAGLQNRNHCPYCLCSRHVDLRRAGDRLANCRAPMRPIGLTATRSRDKYGQERPGELMLIHRCAGCGALSINRIAGDDDPDALLELFRGGAAPGPELRAALAAAGISPLGPADAPLVRRRLLGGR